MATPKATLEKRALAEDNKSEGMRMLLKEGYTVAQVKDLFGAPYGFVYGVANRAGLVTATPRAPKAAKAAKAPARPAKAAAKAPAKAKTSAKAPAAPVRSKAAQRSADRRAAARVAKA